MAKIVDLTDKLDSEEKPGIKIGKIVIKVNNDAKSVLLLMNLTNREDISEVEQITKGINLLFDAKERKKLDALNLNFKSYTEVFKEAMMLATGVDEDELGEEQTHTTT